MKNRTRRQFLEDSMFAAAAAVAAGASSRVVAQEQPQSSSPNERLSVAVVGVRGRGQSHLGAFAGRRDTTVTHICDPDSDIGTTRAAEVAKRQGGVAPEYVRDLRDLMDNDSIDIVTIATPNHWHSLAAIWAIQAGKDVYLEKPVSHNVSEGRRVVEAARKYEKICQTGTQSRSNPGMREAMEFVQNGGIGTVNLARGLCYKRRGSIGAKGMYEVPESIDYNLWLGPAPEASLTRPQFHYDWHWQWAYGNGDLGNQGIHQMDLARWGLGLNSLSKNIFSYGGRFGYEDAGETANTQVIVHDYEDKSLVFEVRGLNTSGYKNSKIGVIFEGDEGYVVMTTYYSGAAFDLEGNKIKEFNAEGNHYENFMQAVRSRRITDLHADIEEGHLSSALCHLGNISYSLGSKMSVTEAAEVAAKIGSQDNDSSTFGRTVDHLKENDVDVSNLQMQVGKVLAFDSVSETFKDDAEADRLLTREYREGFKVPDQGKV